MTDARKQNKVVLGFLCGMSLGHTLPVSVDEFDAAFIKKQSATNARMRVIDDFVDSVKHDCVLESKFFNFFDLPDHIQKCNYNRNDYENVVLKMLKGVKAHYLKIKCEQEPNKPKEEIFITEHDLTPLEHLDIVRLRMRRKLEEKVVMISTFINQVKEAVKEQLAPHKDSHNVKVLKTLELNMLVDHLNGYIDKQQLDYFTVSYQNTKLHETLVKSQREFMSAMAVSDAYEAVFKCQQSTN